MGQGSSRPSQTALDSQGQAEGLTYWRSQSVSRPRLTRPAARSEHEALLFIHRGSDLGTVEDQEGFHGCVPNALVAIDKRVAFDQCKAERRRFLNQRGVQIGGAEGGLGLRDGGLERAQIANPGGAAGCAEDEAVKFNDLPQREIPHQAKRWYSSWFFRRPRSAALLKSSSRVASRSARAARARSSGARPRRVASWRSRSACIGERSMVSFMRLLYRVGAPSNKPLPEIGCAGR